MQTDAPANKSEALPIMGRLKAETAPEHARVDALMDLPGMTRARYIASLLALRDAHAAVERELARHATSLADSGYDVTARSKLAWLDADLAALDAAAAPATLPAFTLDSVPAACGAIYVMEGSTLGGQVIARHVATALGLSPESGCRYFSGYGRETGVRWREAGAAISQCADAYGEDAGDVMISAARETFALVEAALRNRLNA